MQSSHIGHHFHPETTTPFIGMLGCNFKSNLLQLDSDVEDFRCFTRSPVEPSLMAAACS
jgi:hypothetical protein